jgi:hypothetical protein
LELLRRHWCSLRLLVLRRGRRSQVGPRSLRLLELLWNSGRCRRLVVLVLRSLRLLVLRRGRRSRLRLLWDRRGRRL